MGRLKRFTERVKGFAKKYRKQILSLALAVSTVGAGRGIVYTTDTSRKRIKPILRGDIRI